MDRHTKLERMQAEVLGRPVSKEVTSRLTKEYANLMQSEFTSVPLMPGAREFLIKHHLTKVLFAVSEAPHNEVVTALRAKGIDRFFSGIQGFPPTKATSIVALLKKHNLEPSLARLIGDSWTDQSAAEKSGLDFVQINGDARIRLPDALCYSSLGEIPD
jgi:phosphoglycolate phosphatase-like HAD superfamily hydrolase